MMHLSVPLRPTGTRATQRQLALHSQAVNSRPPEPNPAFCSDLTQPRLRWMQVLGGQTPDQPASVQLRVSLCASWSAIAQKAAKAGERALHQDRYLAEPRQ